MTKIELDEIDKKILREALSITNHHAVTNVDDIEEKDELISIIEDLIGEVNHLQEEYDDLERDLEDNYRPIPLSEQYCVYDRDFI